MKRLLSLLTVFVMVFALSVPASASFTSEVDKYDLPELPYGLYPEDLQWDLYLIDGVYTLYVKQDCYSTWRISAASNHWYQITVAGGFWNGGDGSSYAPWEEYTLIDGRWEQTDVGEGDRGVTVWINNGENYYLASNYDIVQTGDNPGQVLIPAGPPENFCDGSACPATDMNLDGICDDCGKTLSLRLSSYPTLPSVSGSNLEGVVLQRDAGYFYMALTSDTSYSVSGTLGDNYLITVANEQEVNYTTYKCTDGKNWVHNNSGKAYSLSVGESSATLLASTFDWYKDGELFFPHPPTLEEVTQEALGEMTQTMGGTMSTLVLCGVGCLALLVVLKLFGKRSLLSLR